MTTNTSTRVTGALALGLIFIPLFAQAHPGHPDGFAAGAVHPFSGLDHLAAMVAVGLWAAQIGGKARLLLPLSFLAAMFLGGTIGTQMAAAFGIESAVAASVFLLGALVAAARQIPVRFAIAMTALFGAFHGLAHGSELATSSSPGAYAAGVLASTATLHTVGICVGLLSIAASRPAWVRFAGATVVLCGLLSLASLP